MIHNKNQNEGIPEDTISYGFKKSYDDTDDIIGNKDKPIVDISQHRDFIKTIFHVNRAGVTTLRPHVRFFTTNYDTLLEDALSFEQIECIDGFSGGAIGYWNANAFKQKLSGPGAILHKLHGSIDWHFDGDQNLLKCRDGIYKRSELGNALVYPQQTKFLATQRDPFSQLFKQFRECLLSRQDQVLAICGYSFGDEHINLEIQNSLNRIDNKTTVICFVKEPENIDTGLPQIPPVLEEWLNESSWSNRIFVLTDRGLYWGSTVNIHPAPEESPHGEWTFKGVTELLKNGAILGGEYAAV